MRTVTQRIGNTKITVHGFALAMSSEEQQEHFKKLQDSGDPTMLRIAGIILKHYESGGHSATARESA